MKSATTINSKEVEAVENVYKGTQKYLEKESICYYKM